MAGLLLGLLAAVAARARFARCSSVSHHATSFAAGVGVVLLAVGFASFIAARRAGAIEPLTLLRE